MTLNNFISDFININHKIPQLQESYISKLKT